MGVKSIARSSVVTVSPESTVLDASKLMAETNVGSVVVVDEGKPVGLLTDRDIVVRVVKENKPYDTAVKDVMTADPVVINENDGLFEALEKVKNKGVRRYPVVDNEGKLTGILTLDDIVYLLGKEMGDIAQIIEKEAPNL